MEVASIDVSGNLTIANSSIKVVGNVNLENTLVALEGTILIGGLKKGENYLFTLGNLTLNSQSVLIVDPKMNINFSGCANFDGTFKYNTPVQTNFSQKVRKILVMTYGCYSGKFSSVIVPQTQSCSKVGSLFEEFGFFLNIDSTTCFSSSSTKYTSIFLLIFTIIKTVILH